MTERRPRIAVDVRPLAHKFNGIQTYTSELIKRLVRDDSFHWYLYSDQPFDEDVTSSAVVIRCQNNRSRMRSSFVAQSAFPRWCSRDKCELFWSPRHQLPFGLARQTKTVVTIHDLVFKTHPQTMTLAGRWLERLITPYSINRADVVLTTSKAVERELHDRFPRSRGKIAVTQLAGARTIASPPVTETRPGPPYFVVCGSLEPRKNLDRLIQAFVDLKQSSNPPPHKLLVITGGGWRDAQTRESIRRHADFIELHERIPELEKNRILQQADFLALPSLYEGFGIPLVEAMQLGLPVLASRAGAIAEVAGDAATYVTPTDIGSIRAGLNRMFCDEQMRASLAQAAIQRGRLFTWEKTAAQTLEALKALAVR